MESGAEPATAQTLIQVPKMSVPQYLTTIPEAETYAVQADEKQFRGWTLGGVLWRLRQGLRRARLLLKDSELMSAACMTSLMLCLCAMSFYV